ncbi:MAG: DUF3093 domain-containing protein [Actinomycetes bacterium]|jgi:hypothetical protein
MYLEKVYPPPISWFLAIIFGAAIGVVFGAPFGYIAGFIAGGMAAGVVVFALWRSIYEIVINTETLMAEGNTIQRKHITGCQALDRVATRRALGPEADPAASVIMRGWVHSAVKVTIKDPESSVPYLFISSRQPEKIRQALNY